MIASRAGFGPILLRSDGVGPAYLHKRGHSILVRGALEWAPRDPSFAHREALARMGLSRHARGGLGDRFQSGLRTDPAPLRHGGGLHSKGGKTTGIKRKIVPGAAGR